MIENIACVASSSERRTALVTGASGEIGRACARALAKQGFNLALHAHTNRASADQEIADLPQRAARAQVFSADLSDPTSARGLVRAVAEALGPPTVLVHCAGAILEKPIAFTTPGEFSNLMEIHLMSAFTMAKEMTCHLKTVKDGRLVFLSSLAGVVGLGNGSAYAATKGALTGLAKTLALECARWGTTVNVVAPGYVETRMTGHHDEKRKEKVTRSIPLGRYGQPEDVAAVVAHLCSPEAGYMTGQVLVLDGGLSLTQ